MLKIVKVCCNLSLDIFSLSRIIFCKTKYKHIIRSSIYFLSGTISSQANEILVEFWLIHGRQPRTGRNLVSDYHESNWHSVPLKWGGGYAIYHWGNSNIHINQDGIYHRGDTGRRVILTSGSRILDTNPTAPSDSTPPPAETITPSYVRRVMWR